MESILPPTSQNIDEIKNEIIGKYSFYLKEIRKKLITTIVVFLIGTISGFIFYEQIIGFLVNILSLDGINIVFTSPFQFINLSISCGIAVGLFVAFPVLIFQILSFLRPALNREEFKTIKKYMPYSLLLFVTGFAFGAYMMKWQIGYFLSRASSLGIGNVLDISNLLSTILLTSSIMGLCFQFPIVLIILMKINLITPKDLSKWRMWVYLAVFLLILLLPINSILADALLTIPLILMYEAIILMGKLNKKNYSKKAKS